MADKLTPEQRHRCMSHIHSKDTKPEMIVRKYLFAKGFRYRLYDKRLPGTPDIVLPKYRTVIFVNGCFWHGHEGCKYATMPKKNHDFWQEKINGNILRDKKIIMQLRDMGWHTILIWQCQLKPKVRNDYLKSLAYTINEMMLANYRVRPYKFTNKDNNSELVADKLSDYNKNGD